MDSPCAMADSEQSFACSLRDTANIAVYSDDELKPTLVPAKISTKNDFWHDTMIARFEANHLEAGRHAFVHVAYPFPTGHTRPSVTDIKKEYHADESLLVSFVIDGREYRLELSGSQLRIL